MFASRKGLRRELVAGLLAATLAGPVLAQEKPEHHLYEEGLAAYEAGDYGTALRLWMRTVHRGDPDAAYSIAVLFEYGLGVEPSLSTALQWYQYAADYGSPEAIRRLMQGPPTD